MDKESSLSMKKFNELLEDIKSFAVDSVEVVEQVPSINPLGMLGIAKHIWDYQKERKMKKFLQGLARKLNENGRYDYKDRERIREFLGHERTKEKFFGILNEALNSVSEISSEILGYFAGEILLSIRKIDYTSSVIIQALRNMNDWDIKYFSKAYNFLITLPEDKHTHGVNATSLYFGLTPDEFDDSSDEIDKLIFTNDDLIEFKSSLMKMSNLQVINTGGLIFASDANTFLRSKNGDKLNDLINLYSDAD